MNPRIAKLRQRLGIEPDAQPATPTPADAQAYLADTVAQRLTEATPARFRHEHPIDGGVAAWVDAYTADPTATGSLLLLGTTGTAKTHHGWWALREAVTRAYRAGQRPTWKAVEHAEFNARTAWSKHNDHETALTAYSAAGLLLFDELGAPRDTERPVELLSRLVNHRWKHNLPTIFTANATAATAEDYLANRTDDRVLSRLLTATWIEFSGDDHRRAAA